MPLAALPGATLLKKCDQNFFIALRAVWFKGQASD